MGSCTECVHFRRVQPASQLMAAAIGLTAGGSEVANAIAKIVDDEQKLREADADIKSKEGSADRMYWPAKPVMSEYCGLQEQKDIFFICEVKNRELLCKDFQQGQPERHACAECAHRVPAEGNTQDQRMEQSYTQMITRAVVAQASPQGPQGLLQSYRGGVSARKALEVAGAYAAKGRVLSKPEYLDYCTKFSEKDDYVVCSLQNRHNICWAWEAKEPAGEPAHGGTVSTSLHNSAPKTSVKEEPMRVDNNILAAGPPPLTVEAADRSIDLVDFAVAAVRGIDLIDVTPAVREAWRHFLTAHYQLMDLEHRSFFANAPVMLGNIRSQWNLMPPLQQAALRQMWASVLPEMLSWIDAALQGSVPMPATGQFGYPAAPPQYGPPAGMNAYPAAPPAYVPAAMNPYQAVPSPYGPPTMNPYAAPPQYGPPAYANPYPAAPPQYGPPAYANPYPAAPPQYGPPVYANPYSAEEQRSPDSMSNLLHDIHRKQQEKLDEAMARDSSGVEAAQIRSQNDALNAQLLTNISHMQFESMMATARNIKS
ncbi:MAG TPA: hypothetical protein VMU26_19825 [Candidatus Polarisedimenticolia bacterium]|nr:hypothetical protein [Candidatus Polarisedimenticolia bacterium]